jgi:hypothetical protein
VLDGQHLEVRRSKQGAGVSHRRGPRARVSQIGGTGSQPFARCAPASDPRMQAAMYSRGSCFVEAVSIAALASAMLPAFALIRFLMSPPALSPRTSLPRWKRSASSVLVGAASAAFFLFLPLPVPAPVPVPCICVACCC